ncbi:MAG: hypothetical protein ACREL7_18395 [Longimicrobiales bacterium]
MPPELRFVLDVVSLALGFALVLWGLRFFKVFVALTGLLVGAGLGGALGSVAIDADNGLFIGAAVGGILGALAAWPLQRVIAFLVAGASAGLAAAVVTGGPPGSEAFGPVFAIGFLIGGVLGLVIFERIVIAALAFTGAQAIFLAAFVPNDVYAAGSVRGVAEGVVGVYEGRLAAFVVTTLTCIGLALWQQRSGRKLPIEPRARALRRVPTGFAVLLLAANLMVGFGTFAAGWNTSSFALTGLHPMAWPFVSMATVMFLGVRTRLTQIRVESDGVDAMQRPRRRGVNYPIFALLAIAALPLATALVFRTAGSPTWGLNAFYGAFIGPLEPVLALKWFIALIWLPAILWRATPRVVASAMDTPPVDAAEPGPDGTDDEPAHAAASEDAASPVGTPAAVA